MPTQSTWYPNGMWRGGIATMAFGLDACRRAGTGGTGCASDFSRWRWRAGRLAATVRHGERAHEDHHRDWRVSAAAAGAGRRHRTVVVRPGAGIRLAWTPCDVRRA